MNIFNKAIRLLLLSNIIFMFYILGWYALLVMLFSQILIYIGLKLFVVFKQSNYDPIAWRTILLFEPIMLLDKIEWLFKNWPSKEKNI